MVFFFTYISPGRIKVESRSLTDFKDRLLNITFFPFKTTIAYLAAIFYGSILNAGILSLFHYACRFLNSKQ